MNNLFLVLNIACFAVIWLWSLYFMHVSEKRSNKIAYIFVLITFTVILITVFIPNDTPLYHESFRDVFSWQRFLGNLAFAIFCINNLYCQVGTQKFKFAFMSAKAQAAQMSQASQTAQIK